MVYYYDTVLSRERNETVWVAEIPDLGIATQGDSFNAAVEAAEEAAAGWILESLKVGEAVPEPTRRHVVDLDDEKIEWTAALIKIDTEEIERKYDTTPVKKTLTIPAWLNTAAERKNVNFSATLKDALMEKLAQMV